MNLNKFLWSQKKYFFCNKKLYQILLVLFVLPVFAFAKFVEIPKGEWPLVESLVPDPNIPFPEGSTSTTFDNHGNYWALVPSGKKGQFIVKVLPAQANEQWVEDTLSGVTPGKWQWIQADHHGYVWLCDGKELFKIDVNKPSKGLSCLSADSQFPEGKISVISLGPNGLLMVAMADGQIVEVEQRYNKKAKKVKNRLTILQAPKNIVELITDKDGAIWVRSKNKFYKKEASPNAWQKNWEEVALLPAGTHDLSGDIYKGKFYMSWAISGDFGYPSTGAFHSKVLEFDPKLMKWSIFADYGYPRGYGGTSFLADKIWAVGGDAKDKDGNRYTTINSQLIDPVSKEVNSGPDLPSKIPSAISFHVKGRLYTAGYTSVKKGRRSL